MSSETITQFYSDDHDRLDGLFETFRKLRTTEPDKAKNAFVEFKAGLEQHMAWEEAILFSEFDVRTPSEVGESETTDLLNQHEQIREHLEAVLRKIRENDPDVVKETDRLATLLRDHNVEEENGLYPRLDKLLTDEERADIHRQM